MPPPTEPTKAEAAAAARAARRAEREAAALRANLHRRKQQARDRASAPNPAALQESPEPCR